MGRSCSIFVDESGREKSGVREGGISLLLPALRGRDGSVLV